MTISPRRGSLAAAVLAALMLALTLLAAAPANAAAYAQIRNQEQPWFSGPVCLEIDQTQGGADQGFGQVEWCSYNSVQQQWIPVRVGQTSYYQLKNFHTNLCLEVPGGVFADGTRTKQNSCGTDPYVAQYQQWSFVSVGGGWYEVVARHSGKCLTNSGWNALQSNCTGASNQHWTRPF